MKTIDADNIPQGFWDSLESYEYEEDYFNGMVEGAELAGNPFVALARIEDDFGWDTLWKLPNDTYVLGDRNSGCPNLLTKGQAAELLTI